MPKISFVVPVFNTEKYLATCVHSILSQSFLDIEIVVVNDCSPGTCSEIIKQIQEADKRVFLIENATNLGTYHARKVGVEASRGEYIAFVDSDDIIADDLIGQTMLGENEYDAYHFSLFRFVNNEYEHVPFENINDENAFAPKSGLISALQWRDMLCRYEIDNCTCSYIVRKELYIEAYSIIGDMPRLLLLEDCVLIFALATTSINELKLVDKRLYGYRIDAGGITESIKSNKKFFSMIADISISVQTVERMVQASSRFTTAQKRSMYDRLFHEFEWYIIQFSKLSSVERLEGYKLLRSQGALEKWLELNARVVDKITSSREYTLLRWLDSYSVFRKTLESLMRFISLRIRLRRD